MIHTTPRGGLLGLQWFDRLLPPLGRPERDNRQIPGAPLRIEIGAATGVGPTALSAFDAALRELGVGDANLIRLSSVIPPRAMLERTARVRKPIPWGDRLYCVYAAQHADELGSSAAAGIGWALRDDGSGAGLFVEHEGESAAEVEVLIRASLADMTAHRPETFGPVQLSLAQTRCAGDPACAVVLAAYHTTSWS
ncbi:arginine decarboxylase [Nocardia amikacinitolerans]|uniref:Pyruvoyl-dependent arginine decarboxylase AaxB n=1 Tax=Nocardia amikacinitolerans TaxID=756689 RepID=A0A285L669_9NOCA|nr:pyruvoyl-dependent arginine decarboxylase [Nocardia amikacinitolerans]MCP2274674.1 arginine decarboxylase [Nocardia amikacinitolerans]MCP2300308.1 arginine decarboxylase [Nocardia amikacinitolerans]MCP2321202.1 arginine decarboxylase [Nocardia amikacinitolerans]SNY80459.1 arginine decarboxylase [Nocardia amikacinitolerans]